MYISVLQIWGPELWPPFHWANVKVLGGLPLSQGSRLEFILLPFFKSSPDAFIGSFTFFLPQSHQHSILLQSSHCHFSLYGFFLLPFPIFVGLFLSSERMRNTRTEIKKKKFKGWLKEKAVSESGLKFPAKYFNSPSIMCPGLSWWLSGKESACQCKRHGFNPLITKSPWKRK